MRHHYPNYSSRFFLEEDNGSNATTGSGDATSDAALVEFQPVSEQERVEGEKPPDFGSLGKGRKPAAAAVETPGGSQTPPKEEAPAGGAPAKPAAPAKAVAAVAKVAKAAAEPAKPAAEPPKGEQPPAKPAKKAPEPAKPAAQPAAKVETPAAAAELPKVPDNDDDIDALKPQPGVPTHVVKSFTDMRQRMKTERANARAALAELERVKTEAAALKESTGKLPAEVEQELEGLRKLSLVTQLENSPAFKREFDAKIAATEETVYGFLQKHGLAAKVIDEIKAAAKKAGGDIEAWPRLGELVQAFKNPVDQAEFLAALKGRRDIIGARSARLAELGESREKFFEAFGKQDEQARMEFAQGIEQATIPLVAGNDWIITKDIPANATKEQREALEAENEEIKKRVEAFGDNVRDIWGRDPSKAAAVSLKAVEADVLRSQVESLTEERDAAQKRTKELEAQLLKVRSAGRLAHVPPAGDGGKKVVAEQTTQVGGDGSTALAKFFANKG